MRNRFYALPAVIITFFVFTSGIIMIPAPALAGCCVITDTASGKKTVTSNYCDASTACTPGDDLSKTTTVCDTANTSCSAPAGTAAPTAAKPTSAPTANTSKCDTSGYKATDDHGLLNGISPQCAVCGECGIADFMIVGDTVVKLILGLSGSLMLLMIVYGGFLWLTSGGNAGQVDKGKKVVIGAAIGLIIVFVAYVAVQFILEAMGVTDAAKIFDLPFKR